MAALNSFRSDIAARAAEVAFAERSILAQLANSSYEGDLEFGKQVTLMVINLPTSETYVDGTAPNAWPDTTAEASALAVDQRRIIRGKLTKTQMAQLREANMSAAIGMAIGEVAANNVDKHLFGQHTNIASGQKVQTGAFKINHSVAAGTRVSPQGVLAKMQTKLNASLAPRANRWAVLHTDGMEILLDDLGDRATQAGDTVTMTGAVVMVRGFNVYDSTFVNGVGSATDLAHWMAGVGGMTFGLASQIADGAEAYPLENTAFQEIGYVASQLFGTAIMRPKAIALADVDSASTS